MAGNLLTDRRLHVAAALALLLGVGTGFAMDGELTGPLSWSTLGSGTSGCGVSLPGESLETHARDSGVHRADGGWARMVRVTADTGGAQGGILGLCTGVGDVLLEPGSSDHVVLVFEIWDDGEDAREQVADQELVYEITRHRGSLGVLAKADTSHEHDPPQVRLHVEVPAGAYELAARTGVGDLTVEDLTLTGADLDTGTGDIELEAVDLTGDLAASTGVGDIDLHLDHVETGRLVAQTGTGDLDIHVPRRADTGYRVHAETGVGDVDVDIGPTEHHDHHEGRYGPGESHEARTQGFSDRDHRLRVTATAGVGDVDVMAG